MAKPNVIFRLVQGKKGRREDGEPTMQSCPGEHVPASQDTAEAIPQSTENLALWGVPGALLRVPA